MGYTNDGKYWCTAKDPAKVYEVYESPDLDGWVIGWHVESGTKVTIVKKFGWYQTREEADAALDRLAVENRWQYYEKQDGKWGGIWYVASVPDPKPDLALDLDEEGLD